MSKAHITIFAMLLMMTQVSGQSLEQLRSLYGRAELLMTTDMHKADKAFGEIIKANTVLGADSLRAASLKRRGTIRCMSGELAQGFVFFNEARKLYAIDNNKLGEAECVYNIANTHLAGGELDSAFHYYEHVFDVCTPCADERIINKANKGLAAVSKSLGLYDESETYAKRSLQNDTVGSFVSFQLLSILASKKNDLAGAKRYIDLAIRNHSADHQAMSYAHLLLNKAELDIEAPDAQENFDTAVMILEKQPEGLDMARCSLTMAKYYLRKGDLDLAERTIVRGIQLNEMLGSEHGIAQIEYVAAQLAIEKGNTSAAYDMMSKSVIHAISAGAYGLANEILNLISVISTTADESILTSEYAHLQELLYHRSGSRAEISAKASRVLAAGRERLVVQKVEEQGQNYWLAIALILLTVLGFVMYTMKKDRAIY